MSPAKARERFELLQARWRDAARTRDDWRIRLDARYQAHCYAPKPKRDKLATLDRAERRAQERMTTLLERIGGRDWSSRCPLVWLRDTLTYDDAVTMGQLSAVPFPAFGYTPADMVRFAEPRGHHEHTSTHARD